MSVESNKAVVQHWFGEVLNGRTNISVIQTTIDETFCPDFVDHDGPDPIHGREALHQMLPGLLKALPDVQMTIEQLIGEGNFVAMRIRGQATHTGEVRGIPPTGKRIEWTENEIYRFSEGCIIESWGEGTLDEALATIGLVFKGSLTR